MPRYAYLQLDGYAGRTQQRVIEHIRGSKSRIEAVTRTKLPGRGRWLEPGQSAYVPLHAVTGDPIKGVPIVGEAS
jgi:hypothetical protein